MNWRTVSISSTWRTLAVRAEGHASEPVTSVREILVIRGIVHDDLRFVPMGCGSAFVKPRLADPAGSDYVIELRDRRGRVLNRERAGVVLPTVCAPYEPRAVLLEGSIALRRGAASLVVRKQDIDVATLPLGAPPKLSIAWEARSVRRDRTYSLGLTCSTPSGDAMVKVFYHWAPDRYVFAGATRPARTVKIGFGALPGGDACRLVVAYSSGLRTAVRTTKPFKVPPMPARVEILRPAPRQVFAAWHPVEFEGRIVDRQADGVAAGDYRWTLDGEPAGTGRLLYGGFLEEGTHQVALSYRGAKDSAARATFSVKGGAKKSS